MIEGEIGEGGNLRKNCTSFSFAVEGGECCEGADEDADVGEGDDEAEPVHHGWRWFGG